MLILQRRIGESIVIDNRIVVTVRSIRGKRVSLGFEAAREVTIARGELATSKVLKSTDPSPLVLHDDGDELPEVRHGY